jgi:hypothetical protein
LPVVDRPKGYFPVPALTRLDGEVLTAAKVLDGPINVSVHLESTTPTPR